MRKNTFVMTFLFYLRHPHCHCSFVISPKKSQETKRADHVTPGYFRGNP